MAEDERAMAEDEGAMGETRRLPERDGSYTGHKKRPLGTLDETVDGAGVGCTAVDGASVTLPNPPETGECRTD